MDIVWKYHFLLHIYAISKRSWRITEIPSSSHSRLWNAPSSTKSLTRTTMNTEQKRKRDFTKLRRTQGCLTDCVAYFLNMHPENVPYFVYPRKGWNDRLQKFFNNHNYYIYWEPCKKPPSRGIHILCGDSLTYKTFAHVVVYKNGKLAYDPQYPSKWSDKRITHRLIVKPL